MKAPVRLLSDRTVLRSKMEGPCPDKFAFAQRSNESPSEAFKRQNGLALARWRGLAPTNSRLRSVAMKAPVGLLSDRTVLRKQDGGASPRQIRVCAAQRSNESPSGAFKRPNGLALARWRGLAPTSSRFDVKFGCVVGECRPAKGCITKRIHRAANGQPKLSTAEEATVKNMEVFL